MAADLLSIDPEPVGASVVETLKEVLADAENGELSSIAIATVYRDGATGTAWSHIPSQPLLLGSVARLQFALARQLEDG